VSISVKNLSFAYGAQTVLENVSFEAQNGRLLAVLGPNGVGKTTLFRCILGLLRGYTGAIEADGADARALGARELARRIAYIPQTRGQAFNYSVLEMVLMGTSHAISALSMPKQKEADAAADALAQVGIGHLAHKSYARLSGGEQQLVLIARALAQQSRTLLMDEPTANLDYGNQARVLETVCGLAGRGYTVLLSTHNPQHALWYADLALALSGGRVSAFGAPDAVIDAPLVKALYGIDVRFIETEEGPLIAPAVDGRRA
jgi:ABC-type cobalamin/Fe3+-siderophores transport system ATPase subunit